MSTKNEEEEWLNMGEMFQDILTDKKCYEMWCDTPSYIYRVLFTGRARPSARLATPYSRCRKPYRVDPVSTP